MAGFVKTKGRADGGDTIKGSLNASSSMPKGSTAQRPSSSKSGDMRFNTDLGKMEYFDGSAFVAYSKEGFIAITQDSFTGDGSTTAFTMSRVSKVIRNNELSLLWEMCIRTQQVLTQ